MRETRHIPIRMCISCRARRPKDEMIRLSVDSDKRVHIDKQGKAEGRGAYVCKSENCLEQIGKRPNLVSKAFKNCRQLILQTPGQGGSMFDKRF